MRKHRGLFLWLKKKYLKSIYFSSKALYLCLIIHNNPGGSRDFSQPKFRIMTHTTIEVSRGAYGEITRMPEDIRLKCTALLKGVKNATKIDEHGWMFGIIESNYKKGRMHSINYDWYGVGYDLHDGNFLGVIQVREFYRHKASYYPEIRKSYFLIGQNEDGTYFAHPVESRVIHAAVKKGVDVVLAVQSWIFGTDYAKVIRQGDLCLVPVRSVKGEQRGTEIIIEKSHRLMADCILENGDLYAVNPNMVHLNGTHPTIQNLTGKYKVVVGKRAKYWSFAKPTLD